MTFSAELRTVFVRVNFYTTNETHNGGQSLMQCNALLVTSPFMLASFQCSSSVIYALAISYNDRNYKRLIRRLSVKNRELARKRRGNHQNSVETIVPTRFLGTGLHRYFARFSKI